MPFTIKEYYDIYRNNNDSSLSNVLISDTDKDGLPDFMEIDFKSGLLTFEAGTVGKAGKVLLPSIAKCQLQANKPYVIDGLTKFTRIFNGVDLDKCYILPIKSDPTDPDGDGDGFYDSISGSFKPYGYYKVKDNWPLTSKPPYESFYQKDAEHYFQKLTVYGCSGSLSEIEQKLVYNVCAESILNIDPNMIYAIALHESRFDPTAENKSLKPDGTRRSTASGYMQILDGTWNSYKPPTGVYYETYKKVYDKYNVDFSYKNDPISNLVVGMCIYAQCKKDAEWKWGSDVTLERIVGRYGEGPDAQSTTELINMYKEITIQLNPLGF